MSDRIRMADSDRPPEEGVEQQPGPSQRPEPDEPAPRREGPEPDAPAKGEPEAQEERPLPPKLQARLDALTREKWEARRQAEQAQQQLQQFQQQFQQWQRGQQPAAANDSAAEERALQRFQAQEAEKRFNEACNAVYQRGKEEFGDFDQAVQALVAVGAGARPDFLSAVAALPDGHRVYRQLAADLDNTARIMALPPMQMAVELARMSGTQGAPNGSGHANDSGPARATRAPPPLRPIGGTSRGPVRLDNMTMAEFIKHRDKEESERRR